MSIPLVIGTAGGYAEGISGISAHMPGPLDAPRNASSDAVHWQRIDIARLRAEARNLATRDDGAAEGLFDILPPQAVGPDTRSCWLLDGDTTALACHSALAQRLLISSDYGAEALAAAARAAGLSISAALGPAAAAGRFALVWAGDGVALSRRVLRLYNLVPPIARRFAQGGLRYARHADEPWLERAFRAFANESALPEQANTFGRRLHAAIHDRRILLWCAPQPVGFVEWQRGDETRYRISGLYMLPAFRRKGQAAALLSEFCARAFTGELPGVEHCRQISVLADARRASSIRLLLRLGFLELAAWELLHWHPN